MEKNKKSKQFSQQSNPKIQKSHRMTAFELAFQKAEAKKQEEVNKQAAHTAAAVSAVTAKTPDAVNKQFSPPHKQPLPASTPLKERTISSPPIITKKETSIAQPQMTKELPPVSEHATPTVRKSPLMNLRLKPLEHESFHLDSTMPQHGVNNDDKSIDPKKDLDVDGRSQVHERSPRSLSDLRYSFEYIAVT